MHYLVGRGQAFAARAIGSGRELGRTIMVQLSTVIYMDSLMSCQNPLSTTPKKARVVQKMC